MRLCAAKYEPKIYVARFLWASLKHGGQLMEQRKEAAFEEIDVASMGVLLGVVAAAFVALGVATRRRGAVHKRYMVLATIAILSPATARIMIGLGQPQYARYFVPAMAAAFVVTCLVYDWRRHRVIHPAYVIGGAVILASWPWRYLAARQDWYQPIGEAIARVGAGA